MNNNQIRALWAVALNELADGINTGRIAPPTSATFMTQFVSSGELLAVADGSYDTPLKIFVEDEFAWVNIPCGKLLDLRILWTVQTAMPTVNPARNMAIKAFQAHNTECVERV